MSLKDIQSTGNKDTRSGFGDGIVEAARRNPNVVALTADLAGSLKLNQFIKEFPERFIQVGIAEANMISIAAGLTIGGKIPFTTTFANFSTGRVYDKRAQAQGDDPDRHAQHATGCPCVGLRLIHVPRRNGRIRRNR